MTEPPLVMRRLNGERVEFTLPEPNEDNAALVAQAADAIFEEVVFRDALKSRIAPTRKTTRAGAALIAWLQPLAYQLIGACLNANCQHLLYARTLRHGRYERGGPGNANPFQLGLMGILAENPNLLHDEERARVGLSLWFAFRHYVPWPFLNGFVAQAGHLDHATANKAIDPTFTAWIVERRLLDWVPGKARGDYPTAIERKVKELRSANANFVGRLMWFSPYPDDADFFTLDHNQPESSD